jgi:DNA-binding CsgD family transcriptional regulator
MSLDEQMSRLIMRIYAASHDATAWDDIGDEILRQTGACAGLRTAVDLESGEFADFRFFGNESSKIADAFREYPEMYASDPSLLWAVANPHAGFCASDATLPADEDYLVNPWVRWNEAHFGATHWYVCYSPPGTGLSHSLSIHVPSAEGAATSEQIAKLQMLFQHLDCATWLQRQPHDAAEPGDEAIWLLLDRTGKVTGKSAAAEQMLVREDGLALSDGRLAASLASSQPALDRCLAKVASVAETGAGPAALWIDRPSGRRPWLVTIRPSTVRFAGLVRTTTGFHVQVVEPRPATNPTTSLTRLFDLSPREAEVLSLLARGHGLESLGAVLGISPNTARAHLRAIFAKTRTSRQAELLQLCAQITG